MERRGRESMKICPEMQADGWSTEGGDELHWFTLTSQSFHDTPRTVTVELQKELLLKDNRRKCLGGQVGYENMHNREWVIYPSETEK